MNRREFLDAHRRGRRRRPARRAALPRTTPTAGARVLRRRRRRSATSSLLHFTDCHAQLLPIYFREPNVNLGVGAAAGKPPHLVGEQLLKHFGIAPGTREAHAFTYLDFARAAQAYGKVGGFAHLATLVKQLQGVAARRAAARRRRHLAGLGHGAVDEGPGHGRRAASCSAST